jgi:phenylpropionate dioxygenase-like ring-hydroxylating dioxygenase large terminal subunit
MLERSPTKVLLQVPDNLTAQLEACIAPAQMAACLPPRCYVDDAVLAVEADRIFRRKWVGTGHAGRFAKAGDYEALELGGVPVIVVRDKDGLLRAFANSCRHRGARLLDGSGNCRGIRCPFHSWAYKLDGSLVGVPHMEDAAGFDKANHGLVGFRAAELNGLAFVCLDDQAPAFADQIGDFAQLHAAWPLDSLVAARRRSFEVACNWKAFLEVFNEYYHLPYVHPNSINSVYALPNPADTVIGEYASQYGATEGTGGLLGGQQDQALPAMPGLDAAVDTGVRYTWVFPNMTFAAGRDALWIYEANPIDAGRCHVTQTACFPAELAAQPDFDRLVAPYYHRLDAAIAEDIPALENQQRGLNSPFAEQGRFSPLLEANVASFARWYAEQML